MNDSVDNYMTDGCGRCALGGTPDCKVLQWADELLFLRKILSETELVEEVKWGVPCYTHDGKNVLTISAFKDYCVLSFFKGALLTDEHNLLVKPGANSQAVAMYKFVNVDQIREKLADINTHIAESIKLEKQGVKVIFSRSAGAMCEEFEALLGAEPKLRLAFEALTPGRQRGYNLYFSQAKQSKTRIARIEKYTSRIMQGKGFYD
ncbi:YdeI/OmpD-associated family protein [Saprospiraceae bacterium]|nr:YdeI/OmpD-associated family protein [Saprospiraceae bacterium]